MIKFSIITVCLNAGEDLKYTIENVLNQTYENFELIIKDGFSTDGSVDDIPNDNRINFVQKKDTGIYDAMNQAIEVATGDYCIFMNAGDGFFENTTLKEIEHCILKNKAAMYYGRCYNEALDVYSNSPLVLTPFFCFRSMICHQAMVFQCEYIKNKLYDCDFRVSADRELLLYTVVGEKLPTQYIPVVIARYKGQGFCENESSMKKIKAEDKRLKQKYFTFIQRIKYSCMYLLTFPHIRKCIVKNRKLLKIYKKAVKLLYRNK